MTTAWQEYERRAKSIVFAREYEITTPSQARTIKAELSQVQKDLRQLKKEIDLDIKQIRAVYTQKLATAAQTSSGLLSVLGKRAAAGSLRADEKRRLVRERDRTIQPYANLKLAIDAQLLELDRTKAQIDQFIVQQTAK